MRLQEQVERLKKQQEMWNEVQEKLLAYREELRTEAIIEHQMKLRDDQRFVDLKKIESLEWMKI